MATITTYVVQCQNGYPGYPPHCYLILKATADSLISGSQGYVECPICKTRNFAAVVQANTLVSTT